MRCYQCIPPTALANNLNAFKSHLEVTATQRYDMSLNIAIDFFLYNRVEGLPFNDFKSIFYKGFLYPIYCPHPFSEHC